MTRKEKRKEMNSLTNATASAPPQVVEQKKVPKWVHQYPLALVPLV